MQKPSNIFLSNTQKNWLIGIGFLVLTTVLAVGGALITPPRWGFSSIHSERGLRVMLIDDKDELFNSCMEALEYAKGWRGNGNPVGDEMIEELMGGFFDCSEVISPSDLY